MKQEEEATLSAANRRSFLKGAGMTGLGLAGAALIGGKSGPAIIARTYGDVRPDHLLKQAKRIRLLDREKKQSHAPGITIGS